MPKTTRVVLFLIAIGLLLIIFFLTTGRVFPSVEHSVVLFSALLMLSFVTLFLEYFFTRPTDVLASTISILLLISPLHSQLSKLGIWYWIFFIYNAVLIVTSLSALLLLDGNRPSTAMRNQVSLQLKRFSVYFGNGRFLFFALFILTLLFYVEAQSREFLALFGYATLILLIDPKRFARETWDIHKSNAVDIGQIIGVQSKNTFIARLYSHRDEAVRRFDLVEFRYSMDEAGRIFKGMIVDNYLLNEQQWVKILSNDQICDALGSAAENSIKGTNVVYKVDSGSCPEFLKRFAGVVVEESTISKVRFDYAGRVPVYEGNLLEAQVAGKRVLYQVVQGLTEVETLEQKNEAGVIIGEAVQLGVWDSEKLTFEKFGWVPDVTHRCS